MMMTRHDDRCRMAWGKAKPETGCPRCLELARGAKPRAGWGDAARRVDAQRIEEIRAHDCTRSGCGPVCTAFDW